MAKVTPEEFAEKQARNLKNAIPDMQRGIENVTESSTKKAAQKADKYLNGIQKAVQSGKWQAGLNRVSTEEWKSKMINKGLNRVGPGIDAARDKVIGFASELLPYIDKVKKEVDAMPDATLEDSIARMTHQVRQMSKFRRSS